MPAPTIRSTSQQITGASSITVTWPTGTAVGDTVIIFCSGQNQISNPSGWLVLQNTGSATWWSNGGAFLKVMDAADISAGSVTFSTSGLVVTAAAVCFVGQVVYQSIETNWNSTATASVTTNSYNPRYDDIVLMFGAARTSAAPTCSIGTLNLSQNNGSDGASALYILSPTEPGLIAAQFSYTGYNPQGFWQAVIVVSGTSPSPPARSYFFVTSSGPFTVPIGFNPTNNIVACIGGGGAGAQGGASVQGGAGGGGGNYSEVLNYPLSPGQTLTATVGAGGLGSGTSAGTDGGDSSLADGVTTIVSAKGGKGGPLTSLAATPNSTAGSIGTNKYQGGKGGDANVAQSGGGGGGGAAGPLGGGGNGGSTTAGLGSFSGGGGGGNGGGARGANGPISAGQGGNGGDNAFGVGHGTNSNTPPPILPTNGGGGAGSGATFDNQAGSAGVDGSGGGSGGGGGATHIGGNYGGGSGGSGGAGGTPANGAQGVIILAWDVAPYAHTRGCRALA